MNVTRLMGIDSTTELVVACVLLGTFVVSVLVCVKYRDLARELRCNSESIADIGKYDRYVAIRNRFFNIATCSVLGLLGVYYIWLPVGIVVLCASLLVDTWTVPSAYRHSVTTRGEG